MSIPDLASVFVAQRLATAATAVSAEGLDGRVIRHGNVAGRDEYRGQKEHQRLKILLPTAVERRL